MRVSPMDNPAVRYVGLEHIEPQSMKLLGYGYGREARSSSVRFSNGDTLYGKMRPYLNKVWVAEFDGLCSAEFLVFKKQQGLNSQFLGARLNAEDFVEFANGQVSGERPRVDFERLSHFQILLPPIAEQERIVAKLRAAFSGVDRAEIAAHRAQERLKRYRTAVLNAATTGELTRPWREAYWNNQKEQVEIGEALLQRLLAARRARWEESELERLQASGKEKDNKWKFRYPLPAPPVTRDLPNLPEGWVWASTDQLTSLVTSGSRGWKAFYSSDGPIFIRSQDIRTDKLDLTEVAHVRPSQASEGMRTQIKLGDLLVTITGANVGRAAVVDTELTDAYVSQHVGLCILRTFTSRLLKTVGSACLRRPTVQASQV
jgi:type I restriction enzyme, S subunit